MLVQSFRNLTLQENLHAFLWYFLILSPTFHGKLILPVTYYLKQALLFEKNKSRVGIISKSQVSELLVCKPSMVLMP